MTENDRVLKKALREWCSQEMDKRGFGGDDFYGDSLVMSERVLQRIIDLAHKSKITSTTVFVEQVQWCDAQRYAEEILEIIRGIYLVQPPKPLGTLSTNNPFSQVPAPASHTLLAHMQSPSQGLLDADKENRATMTAIHRRQCGKCKAFGHIGMFLIY